MKNYRIYINIFCFLAFHFYRLHAQQLVTGNFMARPISINFIDENTGFGIGGNLNFEGEIRKTINGGENWSLLLSKPSLLTYMWIFDETNFLVFGGGQYYGNAVYRTTDAGESWFNIFCPYPNPTGSVCFVNNKVGYITNPGFFSPIFLKTIDGGFNWNLILLDTNLDLFDVDFINENTGFAVGNRIIVRTTDGGNSITSYIYPYYYLWSVDIISSSVAFAAGGHTLNGNSLILKTEDSGQNWILNYSEPVFDVHCIKFIDSNFGIAVGDKGLILKTNDSGDSWIKRTLIDSANLSDLYFINQSTGWIVGNKYPNGFLYKTTNGGINWTLQNTLTDTPSKFAILQNYPNPFNPKTIIRYKLGDPSKVRLKVYDINGKEIKILVDKEQNIGVYEVEFDWS